MHSRIIEFLDGNKLSITDNLELEKISQQTMLF